MFDNRSFRIVVALLAFRQEQVSCLFGASVQGLVTFAIANVMCACKIHALRLVKAFATAQVTLTLARKVFGGLDGPISPCTSVHFIYC